MKQSRCAGGVTPVEEQDVVSSVNERFKKSLQVMLFQEEALKLYRMNGTENVEPEAAAQ